MQEAQTPVEAMVLLFVPVPEADTDMQIDRKKEDQVGWRELNAQSGRY